MNRPSLQDLLREYDTALTYTDQLSDGLTPAQIAWRADENSSAIGWHLGHQPAVAHFMVRNLTAAEPRIDASLEQLMDSATAESQRGELPPVERLFDYRNTVAERVRFRIGAIANGEVGAPVQLGLIATTLLTAVINHEYQHSKWIGEVRSEVHGLHLPDAPTSPLLTVLDGYTVVGASS